MENPFVYGRYVTGEAFTDREEELTYLVRELESNGRIFLISPRRYGKSSLLQLVRQALLKKGLLVAYFDLYKIATMNQFAEAYATAILDASQSKSRKIIKWITDFLPRLGPKISFEAPEAPSVSLDYSLEGEASWKEMEAIYHLPQKIAVQEKKKFVVMFDEFQKIEKLGGAALEKQLRAAIQSHHRVNYVFAGSRQHVLYDMISNRARAFYQLGEVLTLQKIPAAEMARFIRENMTATGFKIDEATVQLIIAEMRNIPNNIKRFELQTSSFVSRGLKLLQQKGLVDKENGHYIFTDIFFGKWVKMGR